MDWKHESKIWKENSMTETLVITVTDFTVRNREKLELFLSMSLVTALDKCNVDYDWKNGE